MTAAIRESALPLGGIAAVVVACAAGISDPMMSRAAMMLLIAGGLTLGNLLERSGLASATASAVNWDALPRPVLLLCLVFASAAISGVSSNTAAAAMLIPIALGIFASPSVAVIVALGASMGVPFVVSTPPNALVYGQGGLRSRDFLGPGIVLMVAGCAIAALLIGPALRWLGL